MPTFAASVMCCLRGWRRSKGEAAVFVAIALLAAQQPTTAATRNSGPFPWRLAQATPSPQTSPRPALAEAKRRHAVAAE